MITKKNQDIEFLRAIAILLVCVQHLNFLFFWGSELHSYIFGILSFRSGVDLFFCISGFVIAKSPYEEAPKKTGWKSLIQFAVPFWIKRIFRIWPSAFLWLAVVIICTLVANFTKGFGTLKNNVIDTAAAVTQVANFHFAGCEVYHTECGFNAVYWSLSLEDQFYMVFPFLLFFVPRRYFVGCLLFLIGVQLFLYRPVASFAWFVRTDGILLGVLIAYWAGHPSHRALAPTFLSSVRNRVIMLFAILGLLATISPYANLVFFSAGLLSIVCAGIVWIASYDKDFIFPQGIIKRPGVFIGTRSYAI